MKTKQTIFLMFLAVFLSMGLNLSAQSVYCGIPITTGNDNSIALLTWETANDGSIIISIAPNDPVAFPNTSFRSYGGNKGIVPGDLQINGVQNTGDNQIFEFVPENSNDFQTELVLRVMNGKTVPALGTIISYSGLIEWRAGGADRWIDNSTYFTSYEYGTSCSIETLATPVNVAISAAKVLTFTGDANASHYEVSINSGALTAKQVLLGSGETLNIGICTATPYSVTVKAFDSTGTYRNSAVSAPYTWEFSSFDDSGITPAVNPYCGYLVNPNGNGDDDICNFTWETAQAAGSNGIQAGDLVITISGSGNNIATFRGDGMYYQNFWVGGIRGTNILDKINTGNNGAIQAFRVRNGFSIPKGTPIIYQEAMDYQVIGANGTYNFRPTVDFFSANYQYGAFCSMSKLATPTITDISAAGVISFATITDAAGYTAKVYKDATLLYAQAGYQQGTTLNFFSPGTYNVTLTAIGAAGANLNSDESASFPWIIAVPATLSPSTWCNRLLDPPNVGNNTYDDDRDAALFTIVTNAEGNIVITIAPPEGVSDAYFKGDGLRANNFRVGGNLINNNGGDFFERVEPDGNQTTQTYKLKQGVTLPFGTQIWYNGKVDYYVPNTGAGPWPTLALDYYIYGSTCSNNNTSTSIGGMMNDPVIGSVYYNLQGVRVSTPANNNIYIVKQILKSGKEVITKKIFYSL